jgi:hypothetical protein
MRQVLCLSYAEVQDARVPGYTSRFLMPGVFDPRLVSATPLGSLGCDPGGTGGQRREGFPAREIQGGRG